MYRTRSSAVLGLLSLSLVACGSQPAGPRLGGQVSAQAGGQGVSLSQKDQWISLQVTTPGFTDRFLRHSAGLVRTDVVNQGSSATDKQDATWRLVSALDGTPCYSFESRNFPGEFLRHQGYRLKRQKFDGTDLFRQDATYCAQTGFGSAANGVSFVSRNLPGYYIRHINAEVWVAKSGAGNAQDNPVGFNDDITWNIVLPSLADGGGPGGTGTGGGGGGSAGSINSIPASSIPGPSGAGVMALKIQNGTNGAYADNNIYWGVLGINPANGRWSYLDLGGNLQPISNALNDAGGHLVKNGVNYANIYHRVSDASWASLPQITSGRMYLCVGSPCYIKTYDSGFAGPNVDNGTDPNLNVYFDFIEFTVNGTGYHGNVTRVDGFGFPLEHRLVSRSGYDRTVGEPETETHAGIFNAFRAETPGQFTHLANLQAPYRILAPIHGDFRAGGAQGTYFDGYVNSVWGGGAKPTTQNVLLCNGPLAETSGACAGLNRHVYANTANWNNPATYYQAAPANYYAQFWHRHGLGGLAYGFAYDDYNQQAAYLEVGDPKGLIIRVGW